MLWEAVLMNIIKIKDLINELKVWEMDSSVRYDENGEAWVIDVVTKDGIYTLHRAFEHDGELYAKVDQLFVEPQSVKHSRIKYDNSQILINARTEWVKNNKSKKWVGDFEKVG